MSFSKEVKTKDGFTKNIVVGSQADLDEAVKVAKNEIQPPTNTGNDESDLPAKAEKKNSKK